MNFFVKKAITLPSRVISYYKEKKEQWTLEKQEVVASQIFDLILEKEPIKKITPIITQPISNEITAILRKLEEIGYPITLKPLTEPSTITVVIPHFNQHKYLDEALFNLSTQSTLPEEVIVVDDQSENFKLVEKICSKYSTQLNLKLIRPEKKLYAGKCKQLGAEMTSSNIIVMHDADDISHHNRIELTKSFFKQYPDALHMNVGLVRFRKSFFNFLKNFNEKEINNHIITTKEIAHEMKRRFVKQQFSSFNQYKIRIGCYGSDGKYFWGCQSGHVAYRKEIVSIVKWTSPFDYVFTKYEDNDFNFMLFLAGQKSYQLDLPLVYYRIGTSTNLVDY